jgi:hypothetical protein
MFHSEVFLHFQFVGRWYVMSAARSEATPGIKRCAKYEVTNTDDTMTTKVSYLDDSKAHESEVLSKPIKSGQSMYYAVFKSSDSTWGGKFV